MQKLIHVGFLFLMLILCLVFISDSSIHVQIIYSFVCFGEGKQQQEIVIRNLLLFVVSIPSKGFNTVPFLSWWI